MTSGLKSDYTVINAIRAILWDYAPIPYTERVVENNDWDAWPTPMRSGQRRKVGSESPHFGGFFQKTDAR
jgi:hypothetical protein